MFNLIPQKRFQIIMFTLTALSTLGFSVNSNAQNTSPSFQYSPTADARYFSFGSVDISNLWSNESAQDTSAGGVRIYISGRAVTDYRVKKTDHLLSEDTYSVESTYSLGSEADQFRAKEEKDCADKQIKEIDKASRDGRFQNLKKLGLINGIDVEVQFATYVSPSGRFPSERARYSDLLYFNSDNWRSPSLSQNRKLVIKPYFSSYAIAAIRNPSRAVITRSQSEGEQATYFLCTVIPASDILESVDRELSENSSEFSQQHFDQRQYRQSRRISR